jgi:acetyltransferase-like isoleucine patch superfamily enzyme
MTTIKCNLLRVAGLKINGVAFIDRGFRCIQPQNITVDDKVSLGHDNHIWAFTPVRIGHHTMTAKDLLIISASHDVSTFEPLVGQEVEIGPGCWIGARVTILGGVKIGRGCVIGAGSVVRTSIPDWSVAVGVPAKVIRKREPSLKIWNQFGEYSVRDLD